MDWGSPVGFLTLTPNEGKLSTRRILSAVGATCDVGFEEVHALDRGAQF